MNDGESRDLFYNAFSPKDSIYGTLVLFPPTWQTAESVINHNVKLMKIAQSRSLVDPQKCVDWRMHCIR